MAIDTSIDYHFPLVYLKYLKNINEKILNKAEVIRRYFR